MIRHATPQKCNVVRVGQGFVGWCCGAIDWTQLSGSCDMEQQRTCAHKALAAGVILQLADSVWDTE